MTPMELRRWPRKNDPDSIRARQDVGPATSPPTGRCSGTTSSPGRSAGGAHRRGGRARSASCPLAVAARRLRARATTASSRSAAREGRPVRAARAHRGRALGVDATRREARWPSRAGSERTCSTTGSHEQAALSASRRGTRSRSRAGSRRELDAMREWLASIDDPSLSQARAAARGADARRRADVPRALALDDRRRGRREHDDAERRTC